MGPGIGIVKGYSKIKTFYNSAGKYHIPGFIKLSAKLSVYIHRYVASND